MTTFRIYDIISEAREGIFPGLEYDHDERQLDLRPNSAEDPVVVTNINLSVIIPVGSQHLTMSAKFGSHLYTDITISASTMANTDISGVDDTIFKFLELCGKVNVRMVETYVSSGMIPPPQHSVFNVSLYKIVVSNLNILNGCRGDSISPSICLTGFGGRLSLTCPTVNLRVIDLSDTTIDHIAIDLTKLHRLCLDDCTVRVHDELLDSLDPARLLTSALEVIRLSFHLDDVCNDVTWSRWLKLFEMLPLMPAARRDIGTARLVYRMRGDRRSLPHGRLSSLRRERDAALRLLEATTLIDENIYRGRAGALSLQYGLKECAGAIS